MKKSPSFSHPNVLLTDLMMPGVNGIEVVRQVVSCSPDTKIIVLSMYGSETHAVEALKHGAKDYLLKDDLPEELTHAIRMVA
ncbi:MAG: response regulator transcription factor [candidate division Zixibacteria bacterium]|nr:response regulator transcription factor [candidate division Zixibacteria bacterium]